MQLTKTTLLAATVAAMFHPTASAQSTVGATPYGQPSECQPATPGTLGLYLVSGGQPALRLEGGTPGHPAMVLFAGEQGETKLPSGGTLLVGAVTSQACGRFDEHGVFVQPLDVALFARADGVVFAQGMQPSLGRGMELSAGLRLERSATPTPPAGGGAPQLPETIVVEEVAGLMRAGALEAALDKALNSKEDALTLDLNANLEVPVWPGITAGGKGAFKASIKRGEDSVGTVVYDLAIGADVAASAGVGAGVVGVGASAGSGIEIVWRFANTHEVARALRSMVILHAVGDQIETACMAVDGQIERLDRAVEFARRAADKVRGAVRSRMPWASNPIVKELQRRQDELRAKRQELVDRARRVVARLIGWVAQARIFLIEHQHGYEVRQTLSVEGGVSLSFGDSKKGGAIAGANVGAALTSGAEFQKVLRAEFVPESDAMSFEHKQIVTRSLVGSAGFWVGGAAAGKLSLEFANKLQMGLDGLQPDASGTTVKITADGKVLLAVGAFVTAQAGVGAQVSLALRLEDLLGYSKDAIAILLSGDDHAVAQLLLAFPIEICARGRYEAGFAAGFGLDIDGAFKGGIGASIMLIDQAVSFEYRGGEGASLEASSMLQDALCGKLLDRDAPALRTQLDAIAGELARVTQR